MKCIWCPNDARENQFTCIECVNKGDTPLTKEESQRVAALPKVNQTITLDEERELQR